MAKLKEIVYAAAESSYWTSQPVDIDATLTPADVEDVGAARVTVSYTRTTGVSTQPEDRCLFGLWVAKNATLHHFTKPSIAEMATLETALDTFTTALKAWQSSEYTLVEYAWHVVDENSPRTDDGRAQQMGPAARITTKSVAGTGSGTRLPDQVSSTVTLRTVSRRHWGRAYLPGITTTLLETSGGRWKTSFADSSATALDTLHNSWQTAGFQLGVYSMLHPAFLTPKQIEADDVADIVRRRRAKRTGYRKLIS